MNIFIVLQVTTTPPSLLINICCSVSFSLSSLTCESGDVINIFFSIKADSCVRKAQNCTKLSR